MARHHSTFLGLLALGLVAVSAMPGSASASEARNIHAPLRQRAAATAVSVGGDAFASASNRSAAQGDSLSPGRPGARLATGNRLEVATAVSAAVSVGGKSKAVASNNGPLPDGDGFATTRPLSVLELGRAPRTSTAVSVAVSIGGVPLPGR
jgi:hypothetical protein